MAVPESPPTPADEAVRNYELVCLAALLVLLFVLLSRGLGIWSMVPVIIGGFGILGRWSTALPLLVLTLAFVLMDLWHGRGVRPGFDEDDTVGDFLLCVAVLAYASAQYRLQGLARSPLPDDPRLRPRPAKGEKPKPPSPRVPGDDELIVLLVTLPVWAVLATVAWELLPDNWHALGMWPRAWRLLVLVWLLFLGGLVRGAVLRFLNWRHWSETREEAAMFMQDIVWRVARGDRRWLQRWRVWARLRADRRKERS